MRLVFALLLVAGSARADMMGLARTLEQLPFRVELGFAFAELAEMPGVDKRLGFGMEIEGELRLFSFLLGERTGITLYDAAFGSAALGALTSTPFPMESDGTYVLHGGYHILGGYRGERFGGFLGIEVERTSFDVGSSSLSGWATPLALRVEIDAWSQLRALLFGGIATWGDIHVARGEADIPLGAATWLLLSASRLGGPIRVPGHVEAIEGAAWSFVIGIRAGSYY